MPQLPGMSYFFVITMTEGMAAGIIIRATKGRTKATLLTTARLPHPKKRRSLIQFDYFISLYVHYSLNLKKVVCR
jgi:hypothetical protein